MRNSRKIALLMLLIRLFSVAALDENSEPQSSREIGEVVVAVGDVTITHTFNSGDDHVQVGAKIYAGDVIKTAGGAALEITFGINVRMRLEANGEMHLLDVDETHKTVGEVETSTRIFETLLVNGVLRTRVKENIVSAQQVRLRAGEVIFFLPRSDFVLSRAPGASSQRKMLRGVQAWGRVEMQLRASGKVANDGDVSVNYQPGELLVAEKPEDHSSPQWNPLAYDDARAMSDKLAKFSVDTPLQLPRDAPDDTPETQGA